MQNEESGGAKIFSIDEIVRKRRGSYYLANMLIGTQMTKPPTTVLTMMVHTDLLRPKPDSTERILYLCKETPISHELQLYSGPRHADVLREATYFKDTPITVDFPSFQTRHLGKLDEFLRNHIDIADAVAQEGKILDDQLMLCRAVYQAHTTGCTPQEAIAHAKRVNETVIAVEWQINRRAVQTVEQHQSE